MPEQITKVTIPLLTIDTELEPYFSSIAMLKVKKYKFDIISHSHDCREFMLSKNKGVNFISMKDFCPFYYASMKSVDELEKMDFGKVDIESIGIILYFMNFYIASKINQMRYDDVDLIYFKRFLKKDHIFNDTECKFIERWCLNYTIAFESNFDEKTGLWIGFGKCLGIISEHQFDSKVMRNILQSEIMS